MRGGLQRTGGKGRLQSVWNNHAQPDEACPVCALFLERRVASSFGRWRRGKSPSGSERLALTR